MRKKTGIAGGNDVNIVTKKRKKTLLKIEKELLSPENEYQKQGNKIELELMKR